MTQKIINRSKRMIEGDKILNTYRQYYEEHSRLQWNLPSPLNIQRFIRKAMSTSPYDAIRGIVRALANLILRPTVEPISVLKSLGDVNDKSIAARELANKWESTLSWAMQKAFKRQAGLMDSVVWNAAVFDEIACQIIHLPSQKKATGGEGPRWNAAMRYGDWAFKLVDVKSMHVEYSEYMPERVLSVQVKTAQEIVDFWGKAAKKIQTKINKDNEHAIVNYFEFDYVDYDERMVWASESDDVLTAVLDEGITLLEPEPWLTDNGKPVPFLPWVCVVGGTVTDTLPEFRRKPPLFPVVQAQLWINSNIVQTLEQTAAIAEAGAPRAVIKGPSAEHVEIVYNQPGGEVIITDPITDYERIQQLQLDPQLQEWGVMLEDAMRRATVADVLVTGQPMQGVETASRFNLQLQTAIASLGNVKNLCERFFELLSEHMFLIAHYTGGEIIGYGKKGDEYTIKSSDIDPENISIIVELSADVPADRIARITAANQMAQNLQYPMTRILPMLGETDPEGAIQQWKREQYEMADWMGRVQRRQMEQSGEIEQLIQQRAQEMMMEQMQQIQQQQQAMSPEQAGGQGNAPNLAAPPGMEGVEGQGFNPAVGGTPPVAAGDASFEAARGATRQGGELI